MVTSEVCEGYVFTHVCSQGGVFHRGGLHPRGVCIEEGGRAGQTTVHWTLWDILTSGRYTSYWNAFFSSISDNIFPDLVIKLKFP